MKLRANQRGIAHMAVFVVVAFAAIGFVGYVSWNAYQTNKKQDNITLGEGKDNKPAEAQDTDAEKEAKAVVKINALIAKEDYLGLASYMVDKLTVAKQGTDGNLEQTKAEAADKIDQNLNASRGISLGATLPWDFTPSASIVARMKKDSNVIQDFVSQSHFAVSANDFFIGYNLNDDFKISAFFIDFVTL